MKQLIALLMIVSTAQAEIITVPFAATLTNVVGTPFGVVGQVGVTPVTGSFSYDTETPPEPITALNSANFRSLIASGFTLHFGGATISSSRYAINAQNDVSIFGDSDIFRAIASDGIGDFRLNGIPHEGGAEMHLVDTDQNMYQTNAEVFILPMLAQLNEADYYFGNVGDGLGTGGASANYFEFRGAIPEPNVLLLSVQALLLVSAKPKRRENWSC